MLLLLSPSLKLGIIVKAECLELDCSLRLKDRERLRESGASVFRLNGGFAWKVTGTVRGAFSVLVGTATSGKTCIT